MREYFFHAPSTYQEVFDIIGLSESFSFLAGGTCLIPELKERRWQASCPLAPLHIIDLKLLNLDRVEQSDGLLKIGPLCILNDLAESEIIQDRLPALAGAISCISDWTVRNVATIGGNIMRKSNSADCVTLLTVLDTVLRLHGPRGTREIPIKDFYLASGGNISFDNEILTSILIYPNKGKCAFLRMEGHQCGWKSAVNTAVYLEVQERVCRSVRVALGGVASKVVRCSKVEASLLGRRLFSETIQLACALAGEWYSSHRSCFVAADQRRLAIPALVAKTVSKAAGTPR